jgi:hypothetical protein
VLQLNAQRAPGSEPSCLAQPACTHVVPISSANSNAMPLHAKKTEEASWKSIP